MELKEVFLINIRALMIETPAVKLHNLVDVLVVHLKREKAHVEKFLVRIFTNTKS